MATKKKLTLWMSRLGKFEYWPFGIFYIPIYFYGLILAFRARSFMYFSAANPGIKNSGVIGCSKTQIQNQIKDCYKPEELFFQVDVPVSEVVRQIEASAIGYPFIIKPDLGERGRGVEIVHDQDELLHYLSESKEDLLVQEYIDYNIELGVFYHRYPGQKTGEITSIVSKEFLTIIGDGRQTVKSLIETHPRAQKRLSILKERYTDQLYDKLPDGETMLLEPIGNHARGTKFVNANHLINPQLVELFDEISEDIDGYYYGRYDLKVPSLDDLYAGRNINIMELNGVSSEPGHIYDPSTKIWEAWRELLHHMDIVYKISILNHASGVAYTPLKDFLLDLKEHFRPSHNNDNSAFPSV